MGRERALGLEPQSDLDAVRSLDEDRVLELLRAAVDAQLLVAEPGRYGPVCLIVLWVITVAAVVTRLVWMSAPEKLAGAMFVGLGWAAGMALPAVWS